MAWIKTTIESDKAQTIHTSFGWVREAWVFVNGKQVFADKNLYMPRQREEESGWETGVDEWRV